MLIARLKVFLTVKAIEEAVNVVTFHVAFTISKDIPTFDGSSAIHPWIDTQRTVSTIEVTGIRVAFFIAVTISCFLFTPTHGTLLLFLFQRFQEQVINSFHRWRQTSSEAGIVLFTARAFPPGRAVTFYSSTWQFPADSTISARPQCAGTLAEFLFNNFTQAAGGPVGTDTRVAPALTSIAAWPLFAAALVGTRLTPKTLLADAHRPTGSRKTDTTIQAWV